MKKDELISYLKSSPNMQITEEGINILESLYEEFNSVVGFDENGFRNILNQTVYKSRTY